MKVLIFGTFDHLHPGHHHFIQQAMKKGDVTVVVGRDRNVENIKGRPSMQNEEERVRHIRLAFPAVTVVLGDAKDFLAPVRSVKPDLIFLGYDQKLPPGVSESDFPCSVERAAAYRPEEFKSSLLRAKKA